MRLYCHAAVCYLYGTQGSTGLRVARPSGFLLSWRDAVCARGLQVRRDQSQETGKHSRAKPTAGTRRVLKGYSERQYRANLSGYSAGTRAYSRGPLGPGGGGGGGPGLTLGGTQPDTRGSCLQPPAMSCARGMKNAAADTQCHGAGASTGGALRSGMTPCACAHQAGDVLQDEE